MTAPTPWQVGHTWQAFSRHSSLLASGSLPIQAAKGVLRHVGVDACELVTPFTPERYGRLAPGCGALLYRDGVQRFSGMVGSQRRLTWDQQSAQAVITVQLLGDKQHLADRLVYGDPNALPQTQSVDYWSYTGPGSTAMWRLINEQAGPFAYSNFSYPGYERAVPGLVMGVDPGVGTNRLYQEQWANLLDTLASWSVLSGLDIGLRIVTVAGGQLRCDLTVPRDKSAAVRFSASLANLTGWDYAQTPPTVTFAIAAGAGDLHARLREAALTSSLADASWGRRIEQYIDQRQESDPVKVGQVATDAIAQGIGTQSLALTPIDSASTQWGAQYDLGDKVTAHIGLPGGPTVATVTDLAREIAFEVDSKGREKITPAVGTTDAKAVRPGWTQQTLAAVADGLARLTRNK